MSSLQIKKVSPPHLQDLETESDRIGFTMPSDRLVGSLLRTLISSKPNGRFVELGTGIGLSLTWMVDGMIDQSYLVSLDNDQQLINIVSTYFENRDDVSILCEDGETWIESAEKNSFDLIFADMWPGKYSLLDETLALLKIGGMYVVDDMLEQPNWPDGHDLKAKELLRVLQSKENFHTTVMDWSTGVVVATRIA